MPKRMFKLEILAPDRKIFSEEVKALKVPAYRGYLGIYPQHANQVAILSYGTITVIKSNDEIASFKIQNGVIKITPKEVKIMVEDIER